MRTFHPSTHGIGRIYTCICCGLSKDRLLDFERWDKLCRTCRAERPRNLKVEAQPVGKLAKDSEEILRMRTVESLSLGVIAARMGMTEYLVKLRLASLARGGRDVRPLEEVLGPRRARPRSHGGGKVRPKVPA